VPEFDGYGRQYGAAYSPDAPGTKSFVVTWLLALFLGSLGIDRFYLGEVGTGVFKHFALGGGASAPPSADRRSDRNLLQQRQRGDCRAGAPAATVPRVMPKVRLSVANCGFRTARRAGVTCVTSQAAQRGLW
jgi:TM2 domain